MNTELFFDEIHKAGMSPERTQSRKRIHKALQHDFATILDIIRDDMLSGAWLADREPSYYESMFMEAYDDAAGTLTDTKDPRYLTHRDKFLSDVIDSLLRAWNSKGDNDDFQTAQNLTASQEESGPSYSGVNDTPTGEAASGAAGGMPLDEEDLPKKVLNATSLAYATLLAVGQSLYINDLAEHKAAIAQKKSFHQWHSMEDDLVRPTHAIADLQIKPIDEPFEVGGYFMMFPCDDSYGAPPEEIVNCRCYETFE